jgi:hypothetical protein
VEVPPGEHLVAASYQFLKIRGGRARLSVVVEDDAGAVLAYRTPRFIWSGSRRSPRGSPPGRRRSAIERSSTPTD